MARTLTEFRRHVREILQDSDGTRYPDQSIADALNNALAEVRRVRPDAYVYTFSDGVPFFTAAQLATGSFPIDDIFFTPCVYYAAGYCELRDDEFNVDARAATLLSQFTANLRGAA